jgi:hypothetical protein
VPVVALLALGLSGLAGTTASASSTARPFQASVSGAVAPSTATTYVATGAGWASHLGSVGTYVANGVVVTADPDVGTETVVETAAIVAANGDTLTLLVHLTFETSETSDGAAVGTGTWTAIGGTGRFAGATGSGTAATHLDRDREVFTTDLTGTIGY